MNQLHFLACFVLYMAHLCFAGKTYHLQVLHNNDLHSRFEEMDENSAPCPDEYVAAGKCYGGFARIKKAADEARERASKKGIPSIFLNAGDNFQDTPYYTQFKSKIFIDMIDRLGLDAMSLGHHEFIDGIDELANYLKNIKTPVVCANLNINGEKRLDLPEKLMPSKKISVGEGENQRNICIVGYLTVKAKRAKTENLIFNPEIGALEAEANRLRMNEGCHFIVALGHSGYEKDLEIAEKVKGINMVVGGDSHTFLYTMKNPDEKPPSKEIITAEYPKIVKVEKNGKRVSVPVVQAYAYGKYMGILQVEFDEEGNVVNASGNPLLLDSKVEKDGSVEKALVVWTQELIQKITDFKTIVGYTRSFLAKPKFNEGQFESTLANLITDAFIDYEVKLAHERDEKTWTRTPISFYPTGGIRATLDNERSHGAITVEDIMHMMPFQNDMYELTVLGSSLKHFLELSVQLYNKLDKTLDKRHYIHFSGLRVTYDLSKEEGQRLESVKALCRACPVPEYLPVVDTEDYHIITITTEFNKFKYNIKNENIEARAVRLDGIKDIDLLLDYIKRRKVFAPILDDRVTTKNFVLGLPKLDESESKEVEENIF